MRLKRTNIGATTERVSFTFDGLPIEALAGERIADALTAAGIAAFSRRAGTPAGMFCGMGACGECLVTIDGRASQRACMTKIAGGESILSLPPAGTEDDPLQPLAAPPSGSGVPEVVPDVLVIGAGPAGLSAALAAAECGARVVVLDERPQPGGQYFKPLGPSQIAEGPLDRQFQRGGELVASVLAAGVDIRREATVFGAFRPDEVLALLDGAAVVFRPRRLILATGAYERAALFPGWTLPGVITTGAAQTLVRSYGVAPGDRVVIAGNGPLNLQLADELVRGGCNVVAVIESAAPGIGHAMDFLRAAGTAPGLMLDGLRYLWRLRKAGVPVVWGHVATRADGEPLRDVHVAPIDAQGRVDRARERGIAADTLCLGYGFIASAEIARALGCRTRFDSRHLGSLAVETTADGETSVAGVFACGDGSRIAGAQAALASGTLSGAAAARQLGFPESSRTRAAERASSRAARFQGALWRIFEAPTVALADLDGETIACRCEGITLACLRAEIGEGRDTLAALKRRTRLGMGRCQARYCAAVASRLLTEMNGGPADANIAFAPRLPAKPFPAGALAIEKAEWGGYARERSTDLARPPREPSFGDAEADVLVVGAGVLGACTAYYLARAGLDVLVVDRDDVNLQASGANAGSLHVQLLSFDFGRNAAPDGGPAARALPLGPWSIGLWRELSAAAGEDFEIATTGGLMVAETPAGMASLEAKAKLERGFGIEAEIIGQSELRRMAPALSKSLLGAEFVAAEGKINPLTATFAVMRLAQSAGARYLRSTDLQSLSREGSAWVAATSRGTIRAGRVINAAGPWARDVGAMAGLDVPVFTAPVQMIVTEPAPPLIDRLLAHIDRHLSLKQAASGGLLIGGAWPARYDEDSRRNVNLRESIEGNVWTAARVLPQLAGLHLVRTWVGMNVHIDGAPIIGEAPGAPGFYNVVSANGYTLAPAVAKLCAAVILGDEPRFDLRPYSLERFS